jgi:hypothetical protein
VRGVPDASLGSLIVYRPPSWSARSNSFILVIDGEESGRLRIGRPLETPVSVGKHSLRARMDDWESQQLIVDVTGVDPTVVVAELIPAADRPTSGNQMLRLRQTTEIDEPDSTPREPISGLVGSLTRVEIILFILALVLVFGGRAVASDIGRVAGVAVQVVGAALVLVLIAHKLMRRKTP